jgi:hypothetical protein
MMYSMSSDLCDDGCVDLLLTIQRVSQSILTLHHFVKMRVKVKQTRVEYILYRHRWRIRSWTVLAAPSVFCRSPSTRVLLHISQACVKFASDVSGSVQHRSLFAPLCISMDLLPPSNRYWEPFRKYRGRNQRQARLNIETTMRCVKAQPSTQHPLERPPSISCSFGYIFNDSCDSIITWAIPLINSP